VIHDAGGGCENNISELTRGQELDNPLFKIGEANIVARTDNASLVKATDMVSKNFMSAN
jgi:hypothetical protein